MHTVLKNVYVQAKKHLKTIVFPESYDLRILKACEILAQKKLAKVILLGGKKTMQKKAKHEGISLEHDLIEVIDPQEEEKLKDAFVQKIFSLRKNKGKHKSWDLEKCKSVITDPMYFATMMVITHKADGAIAGASWPTAQTLRPALQLVGTRKKDQTISGVFLMQLKENLYFFADAIATIDPSAQQLSQIALDTAQTAHAFGIKPKVAMLSFATQSSAKHPFVDKVSDATKLAQKQIMSLKNVPLKHTLVEGPMQVDVALVASVAKQKFPNSKIKGNANVLIFPDLQSANIGYKLTQRLAGARAIGPITQGLQKPINDLSRGCSVEDIVDVAVITSFQAGFQKDLKKGTR